METSRHIRMPYAVVLLLPVIEHQAPSRKQGLYLLVIVNHASMQHIHEIWILMIMPWCRFDGVIVLGEQDFIERLLYIF